MARTVGEIMNRELFALRGNESAPEGMRYLLSLGVSGAPVVSSEGRPRGVVSLKDIAAAAEDATVREVMTEPAGVVQDSAEIGEAARRLADLGYHRLVVVDGSGRAVGLVTALDVVRGLIGAPQRHGASFPHRDPDTGLFWTDDLPLSADRIDAAPEGPGVLALLWSGAGHADLMFWVEESGSIRARLTDLLSTPQPPPLDRMLQRTDLLFRAAAEANPGRRSDAVDLLRERVRARWPWEDGRPF